MIFTREHGRQIMLTGEVKVKRPNPVYMIQQDEEFQVETREGLTTGKIGDYVAHDPISGDVWPISKSYVEQHYIDKETINQ